MKRMGVLAAVLVAVSVAVLAGPAAAITFDLPNLVWPDETATLGTKGGKP